MTNREILRDVVKFIKKNENFILPLVLFVGVFLFVSFYTLSANIHGDGLYHTLFAKEIVKTSNLLQYNPYEVLVKNNGETINLPIYYPLTAHTMMALFYMVGSEGFLKFFSPLFAALTSLFIYLLLRPINKYAAFFTAIFAIVLNSPRFIMTPLIEQPLLFAMMASLYFYYMFLRKQNGKYLLLAGLFLGLTLAIKQQGIYFFAIIFIHSILIGIYKKIKKNETKLLKNCIFIIAIALLVSSGPLINQIQRNGVLIQIYEHNIPPFLESKYPRDPEATKIIYSRLEYFFNYKSPIETIGAYFLQPIYYNHALDFLRNNTTKVLLRCSLIAVLFVLGLFYIFQKDRLILSIIAFISIGTLGVTYLTNTYFLQYNNIVIIILAICLLFGLFGMKDVIRNLKIQKVVVPLLILILVTTITLSYVNEVHNPLWKNSGKYDDYYLNAYKELGGFVQKNTPKDVIFLTSDAAFKYYSERKSIWISELGNAKVPLIFETKNAEEALYWLEYYNISYIFIDMRQTTRRGFNDYIPPQGLLDYIDSSKHFKKIYSVYPNNEILKLYKIIY